MDDEPQPRVPHHRTIIAVTFFILIGFSAVTAYVLATGDDAAVNGSILQTWNNLAVAAGAFWLGSSLGGKMKK